MWTSWKKKDQLYYYLIFCVFIVSSRCFQLWIASPTEVFSCRTQETFLLSLTWTQRNVLMYLCCPLVARYHQAATRSSFSDLFFLKKTVVGHTWPCSSMPVPNTHRYIEKCNVMFTTIHFNPGTCLVHLVFTLCLGVKHSVYGGEAAHHFGGWRELVFHAHSSGLLFQDNSEHQEL